MRRIVTAATALSLLLITSSAAAAVCVKVDEERDNLQPAERQATKTMVEDALREQDVNIASGANCTTTYTIYSLRLGNSVTANISGPEGSRTQKAHNIEELPETYNQITAALITGDEGSAAGVNRHNVTKKQAAPRRQLADSIYYLRLGYGAVLGGDIAGGPAFGFGWRYELDSMGIDISGLNFLAAGDSGTGATFTLIRLGGMYFFDPVADSTPYVSGALSYGFSGVSEDIGGNESRIYGGSGLQAEVGGGYEFLRSSTIRMFVEGNVVLPFYTASEAFNEDDSVYTPSFTLSLGVGYDPDPQQIIEVYD